MDTVRLLIERLPEPLAVAGRDLLKTETGPRGIAEFRDFVSRLEGGGAAHGEALAALGAFLAAAGRREPALAVLEAALDARPDLASAHNNRGCVLMDMRRYETALACFATAVALKSDFAEAWSNRANALRSLGRAEEALACYDSAVAFRPDFADGWSHRGVLLAQLQRFEEAIASQETALALAPEHRQAFAQLLHCKSRICDWRDRAAMVEEARRRIRDNASPPDPFVVLRYLDEPHLLLRAAQLASLGFASSGRTAHRPAATAAHRKIRVGYISADYRAHPTTHLIAHLIESHDRSQFEIFGISHGPDDGSPMRARMERAFDRFIDIRELDDARAAQMLADARIDIAVDLMGHTPGARPGILAARPAPVQVNFLGFAGSLGADWIDHIVADPIVAPPGSDSEFQERVVRLPDVYQPSDAEALGPAPSRAGAGLPESGFVFACFNSNLKIGPETFALWMRILKSTQGSCLWLMQDHPAAVRHLRTAAAAAGVDPGRLLFAPRVSLEAHLARQRCADLFLDTLPYGAHTTASDALWAGLPVLTRLGSSFSGRVAASLSSAAGLAELVVPDDESYVRLAVELANAPDRLNALKEKLRRRDASLFDRDRYRVQLEAAYLRMSRGSEARRGPARPAG